MNFQQRLDIANEACLHVKTKLRMGAFNTPYASGSSLSITTAHRVPCSPSKLLQVRREALPEQRRTHWNQMEAMQKKNFEVETALGRKETYPFESDRRTIPGSVAAIEALGTGHCTDQAKSALLYLGGRQLGTFVEQIVCPMVDHEFVVIGRVPLNDPKFVFRRYQQCESDLSLWPRDAVICDPWAGIVCAPAEFSQRWDWRMQQLDLAGRVYSLSVDTSIYKSFFEFCGDMQNALMVVRSCLFSSSPQMPHPPVAFGPGGATSKPLGSEV